MIGLSNGMIFALVALGYTLVYGIIELINFAHGDIFMLGTFQTQSIFADGSFQIPLLFFTIAIPLGTAATVDSSGLAEGLRDRGRARWRRWRSAWRSTSRSSGSATSRFATSPGSRR